MVNDLFSSVPCSDPKSQKDIYDAIIKYPVFHKDYVWMAIKPNIRNEINARWQNVRKFSEKEFVDEFQRPGSFYSRLWELNLRHLLIARLTRKPSSGEPDLISDKFIAECVVPLPVDVPDLKLDGKLYNFPTDEISRRITTALSSKHQQLLQRLAVNQRRIDYSTTPYVIAICLPESSYMGAGGKTGLNMIEEILMGAKELQVKVNLKTQKAITSIASLSTIQSKQGSDIEVGYFQRESWKPVSAVIWSTAYIPEISDLNMVLNPNASIPLNKSDISEIKKIATYTKTATGFERDQKIR